MLSRRKEEKLAKEAEARNMNFNREMASFDAGNRDDQVYLHQQEERMDLLKWQQDLNDEIKQLKHDLRNEVLNDATNEWESIKIFAGYDDKGREVYGTLPPLINEMGIRMIEIELRPLISRNLINTNLDEIRILNILRNTANTIADNLADKYDFYDIEFANFDVVMRLIKNAMIPTPFRALNDGERRHARTMSKRIEAFTESTGAEPRKKVLGLF